MNTSHNHLHEPCSQESSFLKARAYLSDLSKPEKEVLMTNLGVGAGRICVENFPDEEDLTTEMRGSRNVLKFKDKIFNPAKCSGMGKVFLRKNIVRNIETGKPMNILTQSMFEDEHGLPLINTIFVIQYHYNLDKGFITIPENSILLFAGGSFCNGTVILKNTLILPAAIDIERFMPVNIKGTYKEGSLLYIRKHLRLFDGRDWINLGGREDFGPCDKHGLLEFVKKYVNGTMDIVSPFKIVITPQQNYIEKGPHDILVKWSYNRIIDNQDIRLESGNKYKKYYELDKHARHFIFKDIDAEAPVTIVVSTTYRGETVSEAITLTFDRNPGLVIDDKLDEESTNPVENQTIAKIIKNIQLEIQTILADLGLYLTKEEAENIYATINLVNNKERDIKEWVEDKNYLTEHQSLEEYVKKSELKPVATSGSYNDLTDKPTNVSQFNNDKGYLTEHQSLDAYALKSEIPTVPSLDGYATKNYVDTEVDKKQNKLDEGQIGQVLKWNGNNWAPGDDSQGTSGITEDALRANLRLNHGQGKIELLYNGVKINDVDDEKGSTTSGLTLQDLKDNLTLTHPNNQIQLNYGNTRLGSAVYDETGDGGGGGESSDGLVGDILIYFLKTDPMPNVPATPAPNQIADTSSASGRWDTNAPNHEVGKYIWMSQIYELGSTSKKYGNWSTPVLIDNGSDSSSAGSDVSNIEFIYALSDIEDFAHSGLRNPADYEASQTPDYIPDQLRGQWYDNPQGISPNMRFEFMSYRTKNDGVWSRFVTPMLWCAYGRDGIDGDGVEYIFFKGEFPPADNAIQNPSKWYTDEQSRNGETDGDKKYNSSEYILRGSNWADDPESLGPGESIWVSIRKYRNDVDTTSSETPDSYWHQYSEPALWAHYGKDAMAAGVLDFDNNTMTVPVNEVNNKNYEFADIAYAYVFRDEGELHLDSLTFDGLYQGDEIITSHNVSVNIANNKVTVSIPANELDFSQSKTYTLRFTAQASGVERTGVIKLIGVRSGKDGESYKLLLNTAIIKRQIGTQTGLYIPDTITPQLVITGGDKEGVYTPTQIGSDSVLSQKFQIQYSYDGSSLQPLNVNSISVTNAIQDFITVVLLYNGEIIDQELIFIINDGHDGIPNTVYNIIPQFSNVKYDGTNTSGSFEFKVSRQSGSNAVEYLQQGGEQWGSVGVSVEKSGSSQQQTPQLSSDTFSCRVQESGDYDFIKVDLFVSNTLITSIIIPVIKDNSGGGTQTLELSVLREKTVPQGGSYQSQIDFYCGRNISESGVKYQDFIKWKGEINGESPNDKWGTYLCIKDCTNKVIQDIPFDTEHFVKLDYSFSEVVSYLIADRAFIESLSVNQLVVLNKNENEVVAGMTSGSRLPEAAEGRQNDHDIRIWAGSVPTNGDISSAAFTVDSGGHVKANDAEIKGTISATSFEVVNPSTNNVQMEISTWGIVSSTMNQEQLQKIDLNTINNLSNDSPIIVLTDSNGNKYILNLLSLNASSSSYEYAVVYAWNQTSHELLSNQIVYYNKSDETWYTQYSNGEYRYPISNTTGYKYLQYVGSFTGIIANQSAQQQSYDYTGKSIDFYRVLNNDNNAEGTTPQFVLANFDLGGTSKYYKVQQNSAGNTISFNWAGEQPASTNAQLLYCIEQSLNSGTNWEDICITTNTKLFDVQTKNVQNTYTVITPLGLIRAPKEWKIYHQSI